MQNAKTIFDGDTITHAGRSFIVSIITDEDHGAPWEENEGHGPVSEWTTCDKKPGEWVLSSDRNSKRFYDVAEATRIAKRDGWGLGDEALQALMQENEYRFRMGHNKNRLVRLPALHGPVPYPTKGEITARAVKNDFEYLQGWCTDAWNYVGVCVRHESQDDNEKYSYALWGIASDSDAYIYEVAQELASECNADIEAEIVQNRETLKTIRAEFKALANDIRNGHILPYSVCNAVREKLKTLMADRGQLIARNAELSV